MASPLDDPRAEELLAARPDDVHQVAMSFRTAAGESAMTATGLTAAREDGVWTGHAADSFRRAIGRMPFELERVRAGYAAVADAMTAYEPELARIQSEFVRVTAELGDARSRLVLAQTTAQEARDAIVRAGAAAHFDPGAARWDELAATRADGVVSSHQADVATLTARSFALLDEFAAIRGACRGAIAAAQRTAPVDPDPGQGRTVLGPGGQVSRARWMAQRAARTHAAELAAQRAAEAQRDERRRIAAMLARAEALLAARSAAHTSPAGPEAQVTAAAFAATILAAGATRLRRDAGQATRRAEAESELAPGAGRRVTVYTREAEAHRHALIEIDGAYFESRADRVPFRHPVAPALHYLDGFDTIRHPVGL